MASNAPLELRNYCRKFTLDDLRNGLQPIKLPTGPLVEGVQAWDYFCPPLIQYRVRSKSGWSDWLTAPLVKEGDPSAGPDIDRLAGEAKS